MSANLPKPWKYEDWLIWSNTAIDNMEENRVGCGDTVEGVCYSNLTIQECIEKSTDGFGYHIQFKDNNSLCVPLRTSMYPELNVSYKLVDQSNHKQLNNVSISTFINTKKYRFPPLKSDIIFYFDSLLLKNNDIELILSDTELNDSILNFLPVNNSNINIQFIPSYNIVKGLVNYLEILYDKEFNIIMEGTSLFLTFNESNNFVWKYSNVDEISTFFKIIPFDSDGKYNKDKLNTSISYKDTFTIVYNDTIVLTVSDDNILVGEYINLSTLIDRIDKNKKQNFSIISKMTGYYCDNNKCTPISLEDKNLYRLNTDDSTTYNNALVCRNKDCWGTCKYWDKKSNSIPPYSTIQPPFKFQTINISNNKGIHIFIIVMLILVVILALYVVYNYKKLKLG